MKRHSPQWHTWLIKRSRRLHARNLRWKAWRKEKNRSRYLGNEVVVSRDEKSFRARAHLAISMPETFCFDRNPEETLAFLSAMREEILQTAVEFRQQHGAKKLKARPIRRYYDFATIKHISPTAGLVLAALYDRAKSITGVRLHTVNEHRWDPSVRGMLRLLGFHELLEIRRPQHSELQGTGVFVQQFTSGSQAEGEPVGKLQEALAHLLPGALSQRLLEAEPYGGLFEAILNSHSWAYPSQHKWDYPPLRNWWLTGAVDLNDGQVTVIAYDQGISIPVSLPRWRHWPSVENIAARVARRLDWANPITHFANDGHAIRLAMDVSRSQTNLPQHGKGLHTMVEVVQRARRGRLRIISRHGQYIWATGQRPQTTNYRSALDGTLVEWTLEL